jgi:hypothetical protein
MSLATFIKKLLKISELRGAICKKKMYYNKFLQNQSDANWEVHVYRKQ